MKFLIALTIWILKALGWVFLWPFLGTFNWLWNQGATLAKGEVAVGVFLGILFNIVWLVFIKVIIELGFEGYFEEIWDWAVELWENYRDQTNNTA